MLSRTIFEECCSVAKTRKVQTTTARKERRPPDRITLRRLSGGNRFELVMPPCVALRQADMEEVRVMLEAGESEIALDELRWLLNGCPALLEAHKLLGEISLADGDASLARAHLTSAVELGLGTIPKGRLRGTLPYDLASNRAFHEAGKSLAVCLMQLDQKKPAREVVRQLLALDPSDPLNVGKLVS